MPDLRNRATLDKYTVALHLSVLLFGLAGVFGKIIAQPALLIVAGRVFFAFISLLIIRQVSVVRFQSITKAQVYLLIISGFVLVTHWFSFFYAIQESSVSAGLFMFASFPVFSLILEKIYNKNRVYLLELLSIIICIAGLLVISADIRAGEIKFVVFIWGIYSGFSFALLGMLNKHLIQKQNVININLIQYLIAFIFLVPYLLLKVDISISLFDISLMLLLGVVFTAMSHSLFIYSLKRISMFNAALTACLEPVYGSIAAIILLAEKMNLMILIGGILIIISSFIINQRH